MNELQLLKEQWSEQMWEQRANGIPTITFEAWLAKKKATAEFFNEWKNAESDAESIAEAMCS
jgi:ABC-type Fe3+-hydroxamate transport system substrate-binding protein